MRTRRAAREWALRLSYAHELSGTPVIEVFRDILGSAREDPNLRFCRDLITRVAEHKPGLDNLIARFVDKWDLNRIAVIDHIVLRMAITEFLYFDDIPFKVSINEAIELAKRYSTEQSGRFVNGILDAVAGELQSTVHKAADLATGSLCPVKIGIISDIHSNLEALEAVLRRLESAKVERVYCLGDIVGYGADPNACVERVRSVCHACVIGNHDGALTGLTGIQYFNSYARSAIEWTRRVLSDENLEYLNSLPLSHEAGTLLMFHATPADPGAWDYILHPTDARRHFEVMPKGSTAFVGHSHVPARFEDNPGSKVIVNVGSVGQPRDGDPRASCGLYNTDSGTFEWIREVYPIQVAARKIRGANLPEFLAARLFIGE